MSSFFGAEKQEPQPKQKAFGKEIHRVSTSEQARPVPMICGEQRTGVTFISRPFNIKTVKITSNQGKQETIVGYDYYASFAAAVCQGPANDIVGIYFNGELEWSGTVRRTPSGPGSIYADITIASLKNTQVRIYWGMEEQLPDPHLNDRLLAIPSGAFHPAYRGVCYMVFNQLWFGPRQTNVQNIEVVVRRWPSRDWLDKVQVGNDAQPMQFIADQLQHHRGGLAIPNEYLKTTELHAVAVQLENEHVGISPLVDRAQETRLQILSACDYFDGYPKIGADGRFSIGLIRPPADPGALPVVSETHFTRRPQLLPEDWSQCASETRTVFTNAETEHKEDVTPAWRDTGLREIIGEPNAVVLQRPWFTRPALATTYNQSIGPANAVPRQAFKLHLRRTGTLFETLVPGALFKLNYASRNIAGLILRVTDRLLNNPARPEFEINAVADRSYIYSTPPAIPDPDEPEEAEPDTYTPAFLRIVELPLALCPEGRLSLAVLLARENELSRGYSLHIEKNYAFEGEPAESFEMVATSTNFAQTGVVREEFVAGNPVDEIGLLLEIDGADTSFNEQTPWEAMADDLLIFLGDEILSVHRIEVVDTNIYRFFCVRARFATKNQTHAVESRAFLIERKLIEPLQHAAFQPLLTADFKVVPSEWDVAEVAALDPFAIVGRIYKQTPATNLRVNGNEVAPTYETGEDIAIAWTLTDARRDLNQRRILVVKTVLEFLVADVVVKTEEIADGFDALLISNADLIADYIGSEVSFTVRAKTKIVGDAFIIESDPIELAVTKI